MRTVKWDLAGHVSACMDRLHALSMRGTTGCRQRGKCSVCNNIYMFGWLVLWLLSQCWRYFKNRGLNRITVWISPEMTRFSSTPQLSLSVLKSDFRFSSLTILAQILVSVCLFFILITLPKTPAIQDVKIKNKSIWCPWKICCQFQPWTP